MSKISKKQLLDMIDALEKNPEDKGRILGDAGITLTGIGLGAAAAGTVASVAGATSIFGLTTAASWLGVGLVSATPVGWILGVAAAGGALAYGVSRLIHDGGLAEGRKLELLQKYREDANNIEIKERAGNITDSDKTTFIVATKELIEKDVISADEALELIEYVQQGIIPISQAYSMIENLLKDKETSGTNSTENFDYSMLSKQQIEKLKKL
jgi:hypothetical protein